MGIPDPIPMKCPKCGSKVDSLASSETVYRFQCGNPKCLHQWIESRERDFPALRDAMDRRTKVKEEATMATEANDLVCPKGCGKSDFKNTRSRGAHARHCDGTAKPSRSKTAKPRKEKAPWAKAGESCKVTKLATPASDSDAVLGNIVRMIEDKRTERIAQLCAGDATIERYDRAIAALGGTRPI